MATERRPYHRSADSIVHEPWNNDELAFITRLSALLHTRWRTDRLGPDRASSVLVGKAELMKLSGKLHPGAAETLARRCAGLVTMSIEPRGDSFWISWPKWPEFQGLTPEIGERSGRKRSPSASSVPRHRPKKKKEVFPCPDSLVDHEWSQIEDWLRETEPSLLSELPMLWQRVRAWAESNNIERASWSGTLRTFCLNRIKEAKEAANGQGSRRNGSGGRQTAIDAGREILADLGI